ncbi:hypothetical protein DAPPUDRAFT_321005 [Daphnia pulex]|uniref:E3 ubiquitin-protein ligase n=1 Tax=Daphnia pulex TaxID=6669 RepID=E9GRN9_DAPPU|nr:hypothetical protein DAPPUDRAFT_321005 [Daphnia pulex]|eukprot:EFX77878.1 hypothetical protein DAPPUDRAFT_321005 [Daphnia pulex]
MTVWSEAGRHRPAAISELSGSRGWSPPRRFGVDAPVCTVVELRSGGVDFKVTLENVEDYVELMTEFCLERGIRRQMEALRLGI